MTAINFKEIPLKDIKPDPNQPRTIYDETALQELSESVKEKGVLQPILVRPNGKGLLLVCGERRYRASKMAGLATIPAIVRELTDEEALEIQIIENLQRKDVHPLEEAVAFRSLIDKKQKDVKDIASIVGKSPSYVAQRLKLNDLIQEIQQVFYQGRLSLKDSLELCKLNPDDQKDYYEEEIKDYQGEIQVNLYALRKYKHSLVDAPFDTEDATLDAKAGACTSCPHNSAYNTLLFPDAASNPICMNSTCFRAKCDAGFKKRLDAAIEDPSIVLISYEFNEGKDTKDLRKKVAGILSYNDWDRILQDDFPKREDFDNDDLESEEELEAAFQKAIQDYHEEQQQFEQELKSGKIHKAFVVDGSYKGQYRYIKIKKSAVPKAAAAGVIETPGEMSAQQIDAEIYRIREKEKRNKQLDENKIWDELKTHFRPEPNLEVIKGPLIQVERLAMAQTIFNQLSYTGRKEFKSFFKLKSGNDVKNSPVWPEITDDMLAQMQRFFFLKMLPPSLLQYGYDTDATICLGFAERYFPLVLKEIQDKQQAIATKREERAEKRIKELQAQKKAKQKPQAKKAK